MSRSRKGWVISGAPVRCSTCRVSFMPSAVTGPRKSGVPHDCPRCVREKKAAKKRKKQTGE